MADEQIEDQSPDPLTLEVYQGVVPCLFPEIKYRKAQRFLEVYAEGHSLVQTAKITGTDRRYHYWWKKLSPTYQRALELCEQIRADVGSDEIFKRGIMGYDEELSYKGQLTGHKATRYSDVLAIVAMKARRPHQYRENAPQTAVVSAPMRVSFTINVNGSTASLESDNKPYDQAQLVNPESKKE